MTPYIRNAFRFGRRSNKFLSACNHEDRTVAYPSHLLGRTFPQGYYFSVPKSFHRQASVGAEEFPEDVLAAVKIFAAQATSENYNFTEPPPADSNETSYADRFFFVITCFRERLVSNHILRRFHSCLAVAAARPRSTSGCGRARIATARRSSSPAAGTCSAASAPPAGRGTSPSR